MSSKQEHSGIPFFSEAISGYAVFVIDPIGRIVSWNRGVLEILGYEESEFVNRPCAFLFPLASREDVAEAELHAAATSDRLKVDTPQKCKAGVRRFRGSVTAVKGVRGEVLAYLKILRASHDAAMDQERDEAEEVEALRLINDDVVADGAFRFLRSILAP